MATSLRVWHPLSFHSVGIGNALSRPQFVPILRFRIVLSLAAAGFAGVIPGMIELKLKPTAKFLLHAGGALAVFAIVYTQAQPH